jgi:hypothetical protein
MILVILKFMNLLQIKYKLISLLNFQKESISFQTEYSNLFIKSKMI